MDSQRLKGKVIKKLHQKPYAANSREFSHGVCWSVTGIEFTDGSILRFNVIEGEDDTGSGYGIEAIYA